MNLTIISVLRIALAAALPRTAPAATVTPIATPLCNEPYRSRQGVD